MPEVSTSSRRGALIVIEGLDRSGKSTQAAALLERLQAEGISSQLIKFPDRTTPIGKMIDAYLRSQSDLDDRTIHLLFSANRWELVNQITKMLEAGTLILCDRYAFSGVAFSAAKGLPLEWCRMPDVGLPAPDVTLFFDVSPEVARARGGYGEERYEKEEIQARVRDMFGRLSESCREPWVTVDASQSLQEVGESVWSHVHPLIHGVDTPIGRIWE